MTPWVETMGSSLTVGVGVGGGFFFVRWLAIFMAGRWDAREAHVDKATKELIEQLQRQVKSLLDHQESVERKLAACEARDIEKERRIAQLEGLTAGLGDARQHAALIVASEKRKGDPK